MLGRTMIQGMVGAVFRDDSPPLFATRSANDGHSCGPRELDGGQPHASARSVDQDDVSRARSSAQKERSIGRAAGSPDGSSLSEIETLGKGLRLFATADDPLGISARLLPKEKIDTISRMEAIHAHADSLDDAGPIGSRDERQARRMGSARSKIDINRIHPRRPYGEEKLSRTRVWLLALFPRQNFRTPVSLDYNGMHAGDRDAGGSSGQGWASDSFLSAPGFFFPSPGRPPTLLEAMQTSARNCFSGKVVVIKRGPILAELEIAVGAQTSLVSHVAFASLADLGVSVGSPVQALVKASQVILLTEDHPVRLSTRNQFCGAVSALHAGAINTEVIVQIEKEIQIVAVVTNESAREIDLQIGKRICAAFNPSSVLLAVKA